MHTRPSTHRMARAEPSGQNSPTPQDAQKEEVPAEKVPAGQDTQDPGSASPIPVEKRPASHARHAAPELLPTPVLKVPGEHKEAHASSGAIMPTPVPKVPAGQRWQALPMACRRKVPGSQAAHDDEEAPVMLWKVPGAHPTHAEAPLTDANVPDLQGVHDKTVGCPEAACAVPAGQALQSVDEAADW